MRHQPILAAASRSWRLGDGVAVIPTAPERLRNRDAHYPYRFDSYFWYLSGFPEPEATIVLVGGKEPRSILFCREKERGARNLGRLPLRTRNRAQAFGFSEAHPIAMLEQKLPELIANRSVLWHSLGHDADWDRGSPAR
jgi:Xaa-Pro aminopeptidase